MPTNASQGLPNDFMTTFATNISENLNDAGNTRYFGLFIGLLIFVFGSAGNALTVWAYARNKNLQTSFNVLIANLCLIELLFSAIIIPINLPSYVVGYNVYDNDAACSIVGYLYYCSLTSSLCNLTVIAVNRYSGIVKPATYQTLFTGKRLVSCIVIIWLMPALLYIPTVIGGSIQWRQNTLRCAVGEAHPNEVEAARWYNLSLNIMFQAIPLIILVVLYSAIFLKFKQVQQKMKEHQRLSFKRPKKIVKQPSNISNASSIKPRSGTGTSDETDEDYKPSSLIEGVGLRPVQGSSLHVSDEITSPPAVPKLENDKKAKAETAFIDDSQEQTDSYQTDEEEVKAPTVKVKAEKRNSIWKLLLRNSQKMHSMEMGNLDGIKSPTLSVSTAYPQSDDDDTVSTPLPQNPNQEVVSREKDSDTKNGRRKKSLSVPTLPRFDFTNPEVLKLRSESTSSAKTFTVPDSNRTGGDQSDSQKTLRQNNSYTKRSDAVRDRIQSHEGEPLKSPTSWSARLKNTTKEWANHLSMHGESDEEGSHPHRKRVGTIAKRVQHRREERIKRRERRKQRMLRKKHDRERQLAQSSLAICIAFAICILPTSILHVVQAISGITVQASVILAISCIAWLHAIVNPIIYGYLNSQYRREYKRIVKCIKSKLTKSNNLTMGKSDCR